MIRQAFKKDYPAIYQFVKTAFETAKVSDGLEQDYLEYLRTIPENDNQYEYVAEQDHQIIGHVKLNITFIGKDTVFLLAPLAVHKDYRNQKIGTQLMQHAIQEAKKTTIGAIFLIGDIHYYGRFGFVHSHILSTPQTSFLLELPLQQKKYQGMLKIYEMPKTIVIDGENIFSLDDFYQEIEKKFTKHLNFKMGHNLDALHDVLEGGYGIFQYHESIQVIWRNFGLLSDDLTLKMPSILAIFNEKKHITLKIHDRRDKK